MIYLLAADKYGLKWFVPAQEGMTLINVYQGMEVMIDKEQFIYIGY